MFWHWFAKYVCTISMLHLLGELGQIKGIEGWFIFGNLLILALQNGLEPSPNVHTSALELVSQQTLLANPPHFFEQADFLDICSRKSRKSRKHRKSVVLGCVRKESFNGCRIKKCLNFGGQRTRIEDACDTAVGLKLVFIKRHLYHVRVKVLSKLTKLLVSISCCVAFAALLSKRNTFLGEKLNPTHERHCSK